MPITLARLLEILKEDPYYVGMTFRPDHPDTSGVRSGWNNVKHRDDASGEEFPYDTSPVGPRSLADPDAMYGQPAAYDRSNSSAGPSHHGLTARDTDHTTWDEREDENVDEFPGSVNPKGLEDVEEAMGAPMNFQKAVQGAQLGHATTIPGSSGGFAGDGLPPWDDGEEEQGLVAIAGAVDESGYLDAPGFAFDPRTPEQQPVPNADPDGGANAHDQTDDEVEWMLKLSTGVEKDGSDAGHTGMLPSAIGARGGSQTFGQGYGSSGRLSGHGRYGMIPKSESAWAGLSRILAD